MKKLATFFRTFHKSLFSLAYYHDVVKARFKFSLKYYFVLSLFLGFFMTLAISLATLPSLNKFAQRFKTRAAAIYPANLIITIKDNQVSTNQVEPLHFPIPFELFSDVPPAISDQKQQYLLTIDTKATADDYDTNRSFILITKTSFIYPEDDTGYRVYPLQDMADLTIDKAKVDALVNQILPFLDFLPGILVLLILLVSTLFLPLSRLVVILVLSVILLLPANLMKLQLSYKKICQIGLHAMTLPTILQIFMTSLAIIPPIPFFNSIVFLLWSLVIFAELKKTANTSNS